MAEALKAGARHSRSDMDLINQVRDNAQSILDAAVELGANEQREMEEDAQEAAQTGDAEDSQEAAEEGAPYKRDFTPKQREAAANSGAAMEDGSFPIMTAKDLQNAIQACGRAKDPAAARAHIIQRAKALGLTDLLPEDWVKPQPAAKAKPMSLMDQTMAVNRAWEKMYPRPTGVNAFDGDAADMMPRIMDVFPSYAIVCSNDKHYKVGYSMTDGAVTFAPRDEWTEVQKDWVVKSLRTIRLKSLDATSAVVAGYGIVFGDRDLSGETFLPETNFDLDLVPRKRVYYDHTLEQVKHAIGQVLTVREDGIGLWIEAQLDRSKDYVDAVLKLIERGVLGWSSGSIPHLVERNGGVIKSWPIVEFSLTPTPAEPRTLGVERVKAEPDNGTLPEPYTPSQEPSDTTPDLSPDPAPETQVTKGAGAVQIEILPNEQETSMSAQTSAELDTLLAQVKAQNEMMNRILSRFEGEPAVRSAGIVTQDGGTADKEVKSFADFLLAIRRKDEKRLSGVYKTALSGDSGVTGGYLVPEEFSDRLMQIAGEEAIVRPRAFRYPMTGRTAYLTALDQTFTPSGENSAFLGGVSAAWTEEAGALTETEPTFENIELSVWKLGGYTLSSSEVRADSAIALDALLTRLFGQAIAYHEDYAFLRGNGVSKPLGALSAACAVSVSRATASQLNLADTTTMLSKLPASSWKNAVWLMNQSVLPQLMTMDDGTNIVWLPNAQESTPIRLHGLPIIWTEKLPALGTAKDVALCDFSYYVVADRQPIAIASSEHFRFSNDQVAWRFTTRVGGQPWLKSTIVLNDGSTQISPFVYLT